MGIRHSALVFLFAISAQAFTADAQTQQMDAQLSTTGLLIPLDSSFSVVPFTFEAPPPTPPLYRNDDGSSDSIPLLFSFQFYNANYRSIYINNNGNISFDNPYNAFSSTGFPVNGFKMIAGFWADVDTREIPSGVVHYKSEAHRFIVIWDSVGYSPYRSDKRNSFEIIITDGTDAGIGAGNTVAFSYNDMQWTTGGTSGGSGGFGGIPATVGINRGDGVTSTVIGRFDHEGTDYDGPGGQPDGVSYLDGRLFVFNIAGGWTVYPGDANADGLVDVRDILPVGQYYGKTGPPRPSGSLVWGPQDLLEAWTPPDACYADCNGDGTINASDVAGIVQNWFQTRLNANAPPVDRVAVCAQLLREIDREQTAGGGMIEIRKAVLNYMKNELGVSYAFALEQNWPNPFNPRTTIQFNVPEQVPLATLSVYNLLGQFLWGKEFTGLLPGKHEVVWSGETLNGAKTASGVYVYRLRAGSFTSVKRMLLLK